MALYHYQDIAIDQFGNGLASASVTIKLAGTGTLASLYSDSAGSSPIANPFTADTYGRFDCYLTPGNYDITFTTAGVSVTVSNEGLGYLSWRNPTGTTLYWLDGTHLDYSGAVVNRNATVSGENYDSGFLVHRQYLTGGSYAATQPAFVAFTADQTMTTRGQNIGLQSNIRSYGIGNAMHMGGLLEGWGGAGSGEVSPGSVPLIGSEIDYYVGSAVAGNSTFSATVATVNSTVVTYSAPANSFNLGERWVLIPARTFSGTATSISGTTVNVDAGDTLTSAMVGRYFMLGSQVAYASPCSGLDANIDNTCWPLMYRITAIDNVGKTITLGNNYDSVNYSTSGAYLIVNGALASAIDTTAASITVDNATSLGAQVGDTIYSPPNPWQGLTDQRVYRHQWVIGKTAVNNGAITFNNIGAKKDSLFHVQGNWNYLLRADSMTSSGIDWLDLHNASASHSALWLAQSDGTTNRICFGNSTCDGSIAYKASTLKIITGASGTPFAVSDIAGDWNFQIQRLAAGTVGLGNGDALAYGCGTNGVWLKRSAGLGGAVDICSGSGGVVTTSYIRPGTTTFASLGTPTDGAMIYCSDCTIASPCAGAGTGAMAKRLNGTWVCN